MSKTSIVCLSELSDHQLDVIFEKFSVTNNVVEIWCTKENMEIIRWAEKRSLPCRLLYWEKNLIFSTPNSKIKLALPEIFTNPFNIYFACNAGISKDGYLQGAIYGLCKLVNNKSVSELDFPDYALEMYLYFQENTFSLFYDNSTALLQGTAWEVDHLLISSLKLKTGRLYNKLFKYLATPNEVNFEKQVNRDSLKSDKKLYAGLYPFCLLFNKVKGFMHTISNSFIILYKMLSFKIKKKLKSK